MSLLSRARESIGQALRGSGSGGALYAPYGAGSWTALFQTGSRSTGVQRLTEQQRLENNIGIVHACVTRIAEDISSLPVRVQTLQRRVGGSKWEDDDAHPLSLLLEFPFPGLDGVSVRHVLQQHLSLLGRAALLVVDGTGGRPQELHVLYPDRLDAIPDPYQFIGQYRYRSLSGMEQYFPVFDPLKPNAQGVGVLEVRIPDPTNPYAGNSTVQGGANSIILDAEVRGYGRYFFANNAMPGSVLESKEPYPGPEVAQAQRESWNAAYQGMTNAGKVATLWNGLTLRSVAPAFKDLDFPNITKATRQDILAHFGVPGPVLGFTDSGALGADTFRAAKLVYQSQTLDPHRKRLERMLNALARRWGNCRVGIESPVEDDIAAIEARQLLELGKGALSRMEYRTARGYEDDGQPDVWTMDRGIQVYHGLKPDDIAEPTQGEMSPEATPDSTTTNAQPPSDPKRLASRARALWAAEYARHKAGTFDPVQADAMWAQELPELAAKAAELRRVALERAVNDTVTAYEALKAEARALAEGAGHG